MRYEVPQFIDVEDKIFGPFTFRQFIYLVGGGGLAYILFRFLPIYISIILIPAVVGLALALAFYKVNNKPFIYMLEAAVKYATKSKLYIWKKQERPINAKNAPENEPSVMGMLPKMGDSKLRELTWSLGVKEAENPVTRSGN